MKRVRSAAQAIWSAVRKPFALLKPGAVTGTMARQEQGACDRATFGCLTERYHVLGMLGEGGNGQVFRAWDSCLCKEVAIKVAFADFACGEALEVRCSCCKRMPAAVQRNT